MLFCLLPFSHSPRPPQNKTKQNTFLERKKECCSLGLIAFFTFSTQGNSHPSRSHTNVFSFLVFPEIPSYSPQPHLLQNARIKPFSFLASKAHHSDLYLLSFHLHYVVIQFVFVFVCILYCCV